MELTAFKKDTDELIKEVLEFYPTWGRLPASPIFAYDNNGLRLAYLLDHEARDMHVDANTMLNAMKASFKEASEIYGVLYVMEAFMVFGKASSQAEAKALVQTMLDKGDAAARARKVLLLYRETRDGFKDGVLREIVRQGEDGPVEIREPKELLEHDVLNAGPHGLFEHFVLETFNPSEQKRTRKKKDSE